MSDHKIIFGIYPNRSAAETGVTTLRNNGFRMSDISVLLPQEAGSPGLVHTKGSKAPEGAAAGAGTGAVVGGTLGLLVGIGALAIPGVGPFIAAGPIMAALAGIGVGGTVGVVSGALIGFGIPEYEAKKYEGFVKDGGILMSVHVDDAEWAKKAKSLLEATGARDVSTTAEIPAEDESIVPRATWNPDQTNPTGLF